MNLIMNASVMSSRYLVAFWWAIYVNMSKFEKHRQKYDQRNNPPGSPGCYLDLKNQLRWQGLVALLEILGLPKARGFPEERRCIPLAVVRTLMALGWVVHRENPGVLPSLGISSTP